MNITDQARENSEYVRRLLGERQPAFAAALESVDRKLSCPSCLGAECPSASRLLCCLVRTARPR